MARMDDRLAPAEDPVRLRDAALHRISLTRRWIMVSAAGLTAGLAAFVSAILPGKSLGAKSTAAVTTATRPSSTGPSSIPPLPDPASAIQLGVGAAGEESQPAVSP